MEASLPSQKTILKTWNRGGTSVVRPHVNTFEQMLLVALIIISPLELMLPIIRIPGFEAHSIPWFVFLFTLSYIVCCRTQELFAIIMKPIVIACVTMVAIAMLIEAAHPTPFFTYIKSVGFMFGGGLIIGTLCRNERTLTVCYYAILTISIIMATVIIPSTYGTLQTSSTGDFLRQSQWLRSSSKRDEALSDNVFNANINQLACMIGQGAVLATMMAFLTRQTKARIWLIIVAMVSSMGMLLCMSRGAFVMVGVALVFGIKRLGIRHSRGLILLCGLGLGLALLMPQVVLLRLKSIGTDRPRSFVKLDTNLGLDRRGLYEVCAVKFPQYAVYGVGAGNFWGEWGYMNGFATFVPEESTTSGAGLQRVQGSHNGVLQIWIYWGILGLGGLCAVLWQGVQCVPNRTATGAGAICLYALAATVVPRMMVSHNIHGKEFAVILGLLIASHVWLWPGQCIKLSWKGR